MAALSAPPDLDARVVYFPVRHHSPACAWHAARLIQQLKPKTVLIEGPRNATPLIPFLTHKVTRMPVAIYTTYVKRLDEGLPARHAAYYPLCDYSPELAAVRAAADHLAGMLGRGHRRWGGRGGRRGRGRARRQQSGDERAGRHNAAEG